jgi:hypothetical protein
MPCPKKSQNRKHVDHAGSPALGQADVPSNLHDPRALFASKLASQENRQGEGTMDHQNVLVTAASIIAGFGSAVIAFRLERE